jgi:hypothetical protein
LPLSTLLVYRSLPRRAPLGARPREQAPGHTIVVLARRLARDVRGARSARPGGAARGHFRVFRFATRRLFVAACWCSSRCSGNWRRRRVEVALARLRRLCAVWLDVAAAISKHRGGNGQASPNRKGKMRFGSYYYRTTGRIPHGVRTDQLGYPFLLEQQLRAQASLAYLLFCVGIWVGSPRNIPEEAHMYS